MFIGGVRYCRTCGREVHLRWHQKKDGRRYVVRRHVGFWGTANAC